MWPESPICVLQKKWEKFCSLNTTGTQARGWESLIVTVQWVEEHKKVSWDVRPRAISESTWTASHWEFLQQAGSFVFQHMPLCIQLESRLIDVSSSHTFFLQSLLLLKIIEDLKSIHICLMHINICHISNVNREIKNIY